MDRSVPRLPTTTARLTITVRWLSVTIDRPPTIPAADRPAVPAVPATPRLTIPARPAGPGAWRRAVPAARRRLAIAAVLTAAIVLFATVPARVARLAVDSGIWDLAPSMPRPDPSGHVLPLLLGSIVVLAVVSSSKGHHHHDHW
jgi:hypothetical protein